MLEQNKPLIWWTLAECQEYCRRQRMAAAKTGAFCEESNCTLYEKGICRKEWCHDWDLSESTKLDFRMHKNDGGDKDD